MNPQTQAWSDQYDAHVTATIRRFGWSIQYVGGGICSRPGCTCERDDGPSFAYTVGMFGLNHPELLIFDVDPETALAVLNEVGRRVLGGESFLPGITIDLEEWDRPILAEAVPNPGDIVFVANDYYRRPAQVSVPVIQLSHADEEGRFPWEPGCTSPQPRPGEFRA